MFDPTDPLITNTSLYLTDTSEGLVVAVNGKDSISLSGEIQAFLQCLNLADGSRSAEDIEARLAELGMDAVAVREILTFAVDENILVPHAHQVRDEPHPLSPYSMERWDRQIHNFASLPLVGQSEAASMQSRLEQTHIVVIGVGGVGGYVALSAAMLGVRRLTLIDFDHVELSNTSRQVLYTETDIGHSKLEIAREQIKRHSTPAAVNAINLNITSVTDLVGALKSAESSLGSVDLVVLAADTPRGEIQYITDAACWDAGIAAINLGPYGFSRVGLGPLIVPGQTKSYAEYFPRYLTLDPTPEIADINSRFRADIMDPLNGLAAKAGMVEIVKFLTGYATPAVLAAVVTIDTDDWSMDRYVCE